MRACFYAFAAFLFAAPVSAQDAARPEAMVSFFAGQSASRAPAMAVRQDGRAVRASWYGGGEKLSAHTASGARFNRNALTVAHRSFPFGTRLHLSHAGRSAVVTVNDRGPAAWTGREIDVSRAVAVQLGFVQQGTATLRMIVLR